MSAIAGLLSLKGLIDASSEEWVSEYQETILVRNSKGMNAGTTLFGLMARLGNEPAETTEFKWFERDPVARRVYTAYGSGSTAVYNTTATSLKFDDGAGGSVDGIVQKGVVLSNVRTGEYVRCTADAVEGAHAVIRNFGVTDESAGTGTGIAINEDDEWVVITLGKDEGAEACRAVFEAPTPYGNYVQTFNSVVNLANAFKGSRLRTDIEGPLRERRIQALERIARDIEQAYFFGRKMRSIGTNGFMYFTGGIKQAIDAYASTNALNGSADTGNTCTIDRFNAWLQSFMTVGSDTKLFMAGPKAYAALSYFANKAEAGFRIMNQESVWGMVITAINTPFGELDLVMHPLFKEISAYNEVGFVLDMALLKQKVMEPLFLEPNIQVPGADAYKEQFRAKYGMKLKFPGAFGYVTGLNKLTVPAA